MNTNETNSSVIQNMFNHLATAYSAEDAKDILLQKYPDAKEVLDNIDAGQFRITKVEMGTPYKVIEAVGTGTGKSTLKEVVKAKVAKPSKVVEPKGTSKRELAQKLFNASTDKSRAAIIDLFVKELGMTKAGASTYFYSVKG